MRAFSCAAHQISPRGHSGAGWVSGQTLRVNGAMF
jgi:hypothetical protein